MIHVNDQDFKGEVEQAFHEAYMTHTSTSPNYQIIASLDVGRRQVELEGFEFTQRQVESAMSIRRAIATHPLLLKYFKVITAGDMIPEEYRESGVSSYYETDQGWTDIANSWTTDEFVLDPTRVTLAVGGTGWDGDTFKTKILMDKYGIQINKTSRNTVLFMTNIGTTRSSVAYLIEVLVEIAKELDELLDDASKMEKRSFENRVSALVAISIRRSAMATTPPRATSAPPFSSPTTRRNATTSRWTTSCRPGSRMARSWSRPPSSSPIRRAFRSWCRGR